jgi:hypothetical protein
MATYMSNSFAPDITVTAGLYAVAGIGTPAAGEIYYTLGTVVTGSTVTFASSASTIDLDYSPADFTVPGSGTYCLGFASSGLMAVNSIIHLNVQLLTRNV